MGILDEAIRDHLELKRQRGANREELQRLEDEAFGPPSRPGEPDFPGVEAGEGRVGVTGADLEAPTTVVGAEDQPPPPPAPDAAADAGPAVNGTAEAMASEAPVPEAPAAEPPAEEHPVLGDEAASPATPFDHSLEDELDIEDLDLTLDEPAETAVSPPAEEASAEPLVDEDAPEPPAIQAEPPAEAPPHPAEPPVESLETVEHPFEPGLSEHEPDSGELPLEPDSEELEHEPPEAPESEAPESEPPEAHQGELADQGEPESGEDDVLADTPEFLRDAPEDDELWFEQGEPKDFDFD